MQAEIDRLRAENAVLRTGKAVVTPDGKVAVAEPPPKFPLKPRAHTFSQYARRREAEAWRDLCQLAYPNADTSAKG
jgi:hypothetical protein